MSDQQKITEFSQSIEQNESSTPDDKSEEFGWGSFGRPPKDWPISRVEELFEIQKDSADPEELDKEELVRLYSMPAFDDGEEPELTKAGDVGSKKFHVPNQALLFSKLNISKKRFWLVNHSHDEPALCSTEYWPLLPADGLNLEFYLQYFNSDSFINRPRLSTSSTTNSHQRIKSNLFNKVRLPVPPLHEQRKIATVLYTVDRAIEKTEEIKQQIERVRNGVRQDTLSRGIRESRTERTDDELKEIYLGVVPEDWQLRRVDEVCSHVIDCPHSTPNYSEEGTPVVRTSEIEDGHYYPAGSPRVDEEGYQKRISRLEPKPGDVVFTREAPIGEAFKISEGMKLCLGQRLMQLRPKEGVLDSDFLVELIYSDMMQSWFERSARGTTSTHVNVGDIESMKIPVPSIEEQHRIVDILGGFREQLDSEQNLLNQYRRLKHGLMQDLLSGTVSTTDTNIEMPEEIAQYG